MNIPRIQEQLAARDADAVLLTFLPDIRWACGFSGSNGVLIVSRDAAHFITDGRYRAQAEREVQGAKVHVPGYDLFGHAAEERLLGEAQRVLYQAEHVPVAQLETLCERFPRVGWRPATGLLVEAVASKDAAEIEKMRAAQKLTDETFEYLLNALRPGMTEREVAAEIVYQHLRRGAERMAFDPIVASGPNGALPHVRPTGKALEAGELVVVDMGCFVEGYASDMTRTVALGEPGAEARHVYGLVLEAQEQALGAARAGLTGKALDGVARRVIEEGGYGDRFSHGLGHGLGLQAHEWPRLSYHVEHLLPEGAAVTIEPGVYVPERFGVRIEDVVVLRQEGCENLTEAPKELIVL